MGVGLEVKRLICFTLILRIATVVSYAKSLDPGETSSNSVSNRSTEAQERYRPICLLFVCVRLVRLFRLGFCMILRFGLGERYEGSGFVSPVGHLYLTPMNQS